MSCRADCPFCNVPEHASPTVRRAVEWLAKRAAILYEKNQAYGDSAANPMRVFSRAYGDSAANPMRVFSRASSREQLLVRLDDKLSRIARGGKGLSAADEDTAGDLVEYLALWNGLDVK